MARGSSRSSATARGQSTGPNGAPVSAAKTVPSSPTKGFNGNLPAQSVAGGKVAGSPFGGRKGPQLGQGTGGTGTTQPPGNQAE